MSKKEKERKRGERERGREDEEEVEAIKQEGGRAGVSNVMPIGEEHLSNFINLFTGLESQQSTYSPPLSLSYHYI